MNKGHIIRNFFKNDKVICLTGRYKGLIAVVTNKKPSDTEDIAYKITVRIPDKKVRKALYKYSWGNYEEIFHSAGNWRLVDE